jgi:hypothetical protein
MTLISWHRFEHASAREHDFSGYKQSVESANRPKNALNRFKLNPGRWGV